MRRVTLRVSDEMHTAFVEWAAQEHRSLHGQMLWALQRALERAQGRLPHGPSFVEDVKAGLRKEGRLSEDGG